MKRIIMILGIAGLLTACSSGEKKVQNEEFKYLVDEFADLKVMRYQIPEWENLTLQ